MSKTLSYCVIRSHFERVLLHLSRQKLSNENTFAISMIDLAPRKRANDKDARSTIVRFFRNAVSDGRMVGPV